MSNIRIGTLVPDVLNNPSGTISLPGLLSVTSLAASSTLDATSPSSASISIAGGLGIGKTASLGGNILFSSSIGSINSILQNTTTGADNKGITISASSAVTGTRGAAIELFGNQHATAGAARLTFGSTGYFAVVSGTAETARFTPDGALSTTGNVTVGGKIAVNSTASDAVSIVGGLTIGSTLTVNGSFTSTGGISNSSFINVTALTDSTGLGTGSLYTLGGAAISKSFYVGGTSSLTGNVSTAGTFTSTSTSDTSMSTSGGISITTMATIGGTATVTGNVTSAGILRTTNATDSTGVTNGALVVTGGAGITGSIFAGGNLTLTAGNMTMSGTASTFTYAGTIVSNLTADSTALGQGSLQIAGAISVMKTARFGGNMFISGTASVTGATTLATTTVTGVVSITNATVSTSAITGALVVTGGVGISGSINASGVTTITNATESTTTGSGALVVSGGIGVARSINVGTTLSVTGATTLAGLTATTVTASGLVRFTDATESTTTANGSAIFTGGVAIVRNLTLGGNLAVTGTQTFTGGTNVAGMLTVSNALDASSLLSASITTAGGLAVAKSLRVGIDFFLTGAGNIGGVFTSTNATVSSSATTGAVVISGGLGVGGSINVGTNLGVTGAATLSSTLGVSGVASFTNITESSAIGTAAVVLSGGASIAKSLRVGINLVVSGTSVLTGAISAAGTVAFTNITDATSSATAPVLISGALGVEKKVFFDSTMSVLGASSHGGVATFTDATDSSTVGTGSVVVSGGIGVAKNATIGGALAVGATSTFTGSITNTAGSLALNTISVTDNSGIFYVRSPAPGTRFAGTDTIKAAQYGNYLDLFSLGNSYADANHESLQFTTTSTNTYTIMSRSAGAGIQRRLLIQSGATNVGQLTLNTDGSVALGTITTDSISAATGAVTVSGGLGVAGSVTLGKSLRLMGATSGSILWTAPSAVTSYSLTLPASLATTANQALVSDTSGNLSWAEMTTANPTFTTVAVTSTGTGSINTAGGITAAGATFSNSAASNLPFVNIIGAGGPGNTVGVNLIPFSGRTGGPPVRLVGGDAANADAYFALQVATGGSAVTATEAMRAYSSYVQITPTTAATGATGSGSLRVLGGVGIAGATFIGNNLTLTGATANTNNVLFSDTTNSTVSAPTLTTRSAGTRVVLFPQVSASNTDYAVGIEGGHIWASYPWSPGGTTGFKFYANTTNVASIQNFGTDGSLSLNGGMKLIFNAETSGSVTLRPSATTTSYTLTLPPNLPSANNYALVSTTTGSLSWSEMTTANPTFTTTSITSTTPSTSIGTGALIVAGGASIANSLSVKGNLILTGSTSGTITLRAPATNTVNPVYTFPSAAPATGQVLASDAEGNLQWTDMSSSATYSIAGANNVTTPTAISGMKFLGMFKTDVYITVTTATGTLSGMTTLSGFPTSTGYSIFQEDKGDATGVTFSIDASGQILYISDNITGFTSSTIRWTGPQKYEKPAGGTPTSTAGANNVTTSADVTGLTIVGSQFSLNVLVRITATSSTSTLFNLQGALQPSGTWSMSQSSTGPNPGIQFSITSEGQIQYTSPNISGWTATSFTFYPIATPLQASGAFDTLTVNSTVNSTSSTTGALQVKGGAYVGGNIISPKFKVTQVFNNTAAPYPISNTFSSSGGTLVFTGGVSGFAATASFQTFTFSINGNAVHTYTYYYNPVNIHFGSGVSFSVTGISAGTHTLQVAFTGSSDNADRTDLVCVEYPF